ALDIKKFCAEHLDLLVMTHEHLDHMEGFHHQRDVFDKIKVDHVWMSLPSHPNYYERFPKAQPQKAFRAAAGDLLRYSSRNNTQIAPSLQSLLENNVVNPERVDYLRKLNGAKVHYLAQGQSAPVGSPFDRVKVEILAPEKDVSIYYGGV